MENHGKREFLGCGNPVALWAILPKGGVTNLWSREVNLVLPDKVFFLTVSCSLGIILQDSGGCQVISLEHFQILTLFQNGRRQNRGKSNFWTRSPRWMDERCFRPLLCTVKAELGRGQPGLMRWIWDETLPQSSIDRSIFYSAAHRATKWASGRPQPDHLETCVIPLLRVIWLQGFQFWPYFCVMTSFWPQS